MSISLGPRVGDRSSNRSHVHPREMVPRHDGHVPELPQYNARAGRSCCIFHARGHRPRSSLDGTCKM